MRRLVDDVSSITSGGTTESSDSYSYLLRDVENPKSHINEEWEAIERTLYQESGKHVTDPVLLKECKLWRETFPHIRVRGTAVKIEPDEGVSVQSAKSVQAIDKNHVSLSKLNEKREKIKKTVVSQIVERLINKLNVNKENSVVSKKMTHGEGDGKPRVNMKHSGQLGSEFKSQSENESYFERGKKMDAKAKVAAEELVQSLRSFGQTDVTSDVSNDLESSFSTDYLKTRNKASLWSGDCLSEKPVQGRESVSNLTKNEETLRSGNTTFKIAEKNQPILMKRDSLSSIIKPFEMTKKIDKKYETMLERILENKGFGGRDVGRSPIPEICSYRESTENNGKHNRGDSSCRKSKQFPKLNSFTNNWINRADQHSLDPCGIIPRNLCPTSQSTSIKGVRSFEKQSKFETSRSACNGFQYDEKILEELRKEVLEYTGSVNREYEEEINLKRPQLRSRYKKNYTARTQKSSSCGDLPKRNPKPCNRTSKIGAEKGRNELSMRNGAKKMIGKNSGSQNVQLPPIETSITCTEIIGRPKVASRTLPKKYN